MTTTKFDSTAPSCPEGSIDESGERLRQSTVSVIKVEIDVKSCAAGTPRESLHVLVRTHIMQMANISRQAAAGHIAIY